MSEDELKKRILSRRAKFVAAAIAASGIAAACGGEVTGPGDASTDGPKDTAVDVPQPCLSAPFDAGDAGPQPCLDVPLDDAGDAGPQPCLVPPQDGG